MRAVFRPLGRISQSQLASVVPVSRTSVAMISNRFDPNLAPEAQDKILFTPGPLTCSYPVRQAATRDMGSRDAAFIRAVKNIRDKLLKFADLDLAAWNVCLLPGSGTNGVEATISSTVGRTGKLLVLSNGAYGSRIQDMCKAQGLKFTKIEYDEDQSPSAADLEKALAADPEITHVAMIHSETTSGILNPLEDVGAVVKKYNKSFIVDAMSSFGGVPIDFEKCNIDFLVSSSNKCVEGLPGLSYIFCRTSAFNATKGNATTLSLDLHKQMDGLNKDGQFRFTPPTHVVMALSTAIDEMEQEGGIVARNKRYIANQNTLMPGMESLGFKTYLPSGRRGPIITSFHYPSDANWNFTKFYSSLSDKGLLIYPGKLSKADCFRIGHIGRLFPEDSSLLLKAIDEVCKDMKTGKYFQ